MRLSSLLSAAVGIAWFAMLGAVSPALADDKFPSHPITIVVPYEAGGGGDVYSRLLQPYLQRELGVPVIVVNQPGAGGIVGQNSAFQKPADGYTLVLWSTPSNELNAITSTTPWGVEDWVGLGAAAPGQSIVATPADRPWNSLKELVDAMRARPKQITVGGIGPYGTGGIAYATLTSATHTEGLWIPYKGTNDVALALLGGQVDVGLVGGSEQRFVDLMKAHKIKILAVLSDKPAGPYAAANLPTAQQQLGVRIVHEVQRGHVVRALTPADRLQILRDAYRKAASSPQFIGELEEKVGPYQFIDGPQLTDVLHNGTIELRRLLPALKALAK